MHNHYITYTLNNKGWWVDGCVVGECVICCALNAHAFAHCCERTNIAPLLNEKYCSGFYNLFLCVSGNSSHILCKTCEYTHTHTHTRDATRQCKAENKQRHSTPFVYILRVSCVRACMCEIPRTHVAGTTHNNNNKTHTCERLACWFQWRPVSKNKHRTFESC